MLRRLLSLAVLGAGVYCLLHPWSSKPMTWDEIIPHWNGGPGQPSESAGNAGTTPTGTNVPTAPAARNPGALPVPGVESWSEQNVSGLRLSVPFPVQPAPVTIPPRANITIQAYKGESGSRAIYLAHAMHSTLVGAPMLSWADKTLSSAMGKVGMRVMSTNTPTLLHGLRARRSDLISVSAAPPIRGRLLLLEGGSNVWVIECHALESDPDAERIFMRIATSAQPL